MPERTHVGNGVAAASLAAAIIVEVMLAECGEEYR